MARTGRAGPAGPEDLRDLALGLASGPGHALACTGWDGADRLRGVRTRVAPVFPVSDLAVALAYYRGLGFGAREWTGGGYGFVTFDGAEIHLGVEPDLGTRADRRSTAYLFVEDADVLARAWLAAGGDVRLPQDTEWGQHAGALVDPDGNVIRFGSPVKAD